MKKIFLIILIFSSLLTFSQDKSKSEWTKLKEYGVITFDSTHIRVYESISQYDNLNVGKEIKEAHWSGNSIIVQCKDGTYRKYATLTQYSNIR